MRAESQFTSQNYEKSKCCVLTEKSHLFTCAPEVNLRAKIMKSKMLCFDEKNPVTCAPKI